MKTIRLFGLTAVVLCAIAAFQARAQSGIYFTLNFDENGNGSYTTTSGGSGPLQYIYGADPTGGYAGNVLIYLLPVVTGDTVFGGDVRIWDDPARTSLSDDLRFCNTAGDYSAAYIATEMIFYSTDNDGDLADIGTTPNNLNPTDGGLGPIEAADGTFTWAPGSLLNPPQVNNVYNGISEVPEPVSFGLLALGGVLGLCRLLRRKQS